MYTDEYLSYAYYTRISTSGVAFTFSGHFELPLYTCICTLT